MMEIYESPSLMASPRAKLRQCGIVFFRGLR